MDSVLLCEVASVRRSQFASVRASQHSSVPPGDALQSEDQFSSSDTSSIESVAISEEDKKNSIKDTSLANLMKGLPVTKYFEKFGPDDGTITGHAVCHDGYLLHQISYNDGQVDEVSFQDAMKLHHLYLQVHSKESSPLTPPTTCAVDPWFNPLAPPSMRVAEGSGIDSPISLPIFNLTAELLPPFLSRWKNSTRENFKTSRGRARPVSLVHSNPW